MPVIPAFSGGGAGSLVKVTYNYIASLRPSWDNETLSHNA